VSPPGGKLDVWRKGKIEKRSPVLGIFRVGSMQLCTEKMPTMESNSFYEKQLQQRRRATNLANTLA
jgi:hypothetical protein